MEFTDQEYRIARRSAGSVARINNGYLDADDVLGAIYEWMAENYDSIVEWREETPHGALFSVASYRAGLRYAHRERKARTGASDEDLHYYSVSQIEQLLPYCWDHREWVLLAKQLGGSPGGDPATGNNFLASLVDVSGAVRTLPDEAREILRKRYVEGRTLEAVAFLYDSTEEAMRKRVRRTILKVIDKLGGEPPWYGGPGSRKAMSNTASQVEVAT